mgnify:CR=1 FL=1
MASESWIEDRLCLLCRQVKPTKTIARGTGRNSPIDDECAAKAGLVWDADKGWQEAPKK